MADDEDGRHANAPKGSESQPKPKGRTGVKKNAAALSEALRANLVRRKTRERALRANQKDGSEG